jgi:hypothetical protein
MAGSEKNQENEDISELQSYSPFMLQIFKIFSENPVTFNREIESKVMAEINAKDCQSGAD